MVLGVLAVQHAGVGAAPRAEAAARSRWRAGPLPPPDDGRAGRIASLQEPVMESLFQLNTSL